jgi:hypothetical protein
MVEEHFETDRVFYCWLAKSAFLQYVKSECAPSELSRINELSESWSVARKKFLNSYESIKGLGKTIIVQDIPPKYSDYLSKLENSHSFKSAFNHLPAYFKVVEIDKLVALQNLVNLDYVNKLIKSMRKNPNFDELLDICLSDKKNVPETSEMCTQKHVIYSSDNTDIRFLGAIPVSPDVIADKDVFIGGIPAKALLLVFGYGSSPINVFNYRDRMFLNNGFHRVYALKMLGVKHIPVVVQNITDPLLEMPERFVYNPELMNQISSSERLPLLQDLFNKDYIVDLKVKPKRKAVKLSWNIDYVTIPV